MTNSIKTDIQDWWAQNPMTYGATHGQTSYAEGSYELGSPEFFKRVDQEFYNWNTPLHLEQPFAKIFPYTQYKDKNVLEIGCGMGTMLMNWARNGAICTGVDLNPTSIAQTKARFALYDLPGTIQLEDANKLSLADNSFDYAYSWGVLHHSPNLEKSLNEMFRTLKPGGEFGIMLYNRASLYQWYMTDYIEGFLHNEKQFLTPLELNSRYGDGHREEGNPHTWPITKQEGIELLLQYSKNVQVKILGTDLDCVLKFMLPGIDKYIPKPLLKALAKRWGWSLWFYGTKDAK